MMFWMCTLATSQGLPYLDAKMTLALSYPSDVNDKPSIKSRTLRINDSEIKARRSDFSISVSN